MIAIRKANYKDKEQLIPHLQDLWEDIDYNEAEKSIESSIKSQTEEMVVAESENEIVGFCMLSLRNDHVEGSETSPTAYLEGIYVKSNFRRKGIASRFIEFSRDWGKLKGCKHLGSDAEHDNEISIRFHNNAGFRQGKKIVTFITEL